MRDINLYYPPDGSALNAAAAINNGVSPPKYCHRIRTIQRCLTLKIKGTTTQKAEDSKIRNSTAHSAMDGDLYSDDESDDDSLYEPPLPNGSEYNEDFAEQFPILSKVSLPIFDICDENAASSMYQQCTAQT